MTIAVDLGRKATKTKKIILILCRKHFHILSFSYCSQLKKILEMFFFLFLNCMSKSQDSELTAFENVVIGVHTYRQETVFNNILVTWSLTINMPVIISNRTDCLFRTVGILAALLYHDYMGIGIRAL